MKKKIIITSPIEKEFDKKDIKEICNWTDTKNDEAEKYLYRMNGGMCILPNLYIKLDSNPDVPFSTNVSIEDLA